jgi:hypothetical protein
MGAYSMYGIEYAIQLKNNEYITVVPIPSVDNRLLASTYYHQRANYYDTNAGKTWRHPITPDVRLTNGERDVLADLLHKHGEQVETHGWYDVGYVHYLL